MTGQAIPLLASIPSPSSGTLSIGPLELRAYGLMIALGVIAGVWLLGKQLEKSQLGTRDDASSIAIWGVVAGVIGARAYHVITDWSKFDDNLGAIPKIWKGGLGIPGGLLAGILVGAWQAKRRGIRPAVVLTFGAPAIALAQSIRQTCSHNQRRIHRLERFGQSTDDFLSFLPDPQIFRIVLREKLAHRFDLALFERAGGVEPDHFIALLACHNES